MVVTIEMLMDYAEIAQRDAKEWLAFAEEHPEDAFINLTKASRRLSDAAFYIHCIEKLRGPVVGAAVDKP
jgi:hypothetical protein